MAIERFIKGRIIGPYFERVRRQREQSQQQVQVETARGEINALLEDIFPNDTVKEYTFKDPDIDWPQQLPSLVNLHPEITDKDLISISVDREYLGCPTLHISMYFGYFTDPPYYTVTSLLDNNLSSIEVYSVATTGDAMTQRYNSESYVAEMLRLKFIKESLSFALLCKQSELPDSDASP